MRIHRQNAHLKQCLRDMKGSGVPREEALCLLRKEVRTLFWDKILAGNRYQELFARGISLLSELCFYSDIAEANRQYKRTGIETIEMQKFTLERVSGRVPFSYFELHKNIQQLFDS